MRQIHRDAYDAEDPVRSIYGSGLKEAFGACHDPMPDKMEELIQRLQNVEADDRAE